LVSEAHDMNIDLELSGLILHDIVDGGYNWQVIHMQWSLPGLGMRWDDFLMMTVTTAPSPNCWESFLWLCTCSVCMWSASCWSGPVIKDTVWRWEGAGGERIHHHVHQ
jgi:hypothetical protein